jgi:3-hydroxyisobutyrate dehydrogenase-like beta-hydroxyacid dehydrogenase
MDDASKPLRRTGVIGLGAMGLQMARHMLNKGFEVTGYGEDERCWRDWLGIHFLTYCSY